MRPGGEYGEASPAAPAAPAEKFHVLLRRAVARILPAPVVFGFVAVLLVLFAVSYMAGELASPMTPGLHGWGHGGGSSQHEPDMPGMDGMEMR